MKRIADTQISRNDDADVDAEPEVSPGFKKADDSVIATRRIRGLPRRAQTTATLTNGIGTEAPTATPRFAGFAGFGNAASNATPFSFANTSPAPTPASTSSATNPLSGNSSNASVTPFSGLSVATSLPPQSALPPTQRTTVTPAEKTSDESDPALKRYCALRGLNISFQNAVSEAIDKDAFADLSEIFERYKSLRKDFQKEYDDQVKLKKTKTAPSPFFSSSVSTNQSSAPKPSIFPQTSFSGFGIPLFNTGQKTSAPESSTTATAKAGFPAFSKFGESSNSVASTDASKPSSMPPNPFTLLDTSKSSTTSSSVFPPLDAPKPTSMFSSPDAAKTPSLFSDASKPASGFPTLDTTKAPSLFSSDTSKSMPLFPPPDTPKAVFPFGSPDAPTNAPPFSSSDTSKATSEFPSSDTSRTTSLFATSGASKTTSAFSSSDPSQTSSTFPSSDTSDTSKTTSSFPSFEAPKALSSSSSSFTFGASSFAPTDASKSPARSSPTNRDTTKGPQNPFGTPSFGSTSLFGIGASSTDSPFALFGSGKKSDIPFGVVGAGTTGSAPASTGAFGGFGKPSGVIGNPVGFGFGSQASTPDSGTPPNAGEEKSSETPAEDDEAAKAVFATTHHDEDGQGEEDEETIHQVRAKVFKLVKVAGGQPKWVAMGIGMFKVKKNKTSEARRVLLRNSSTGKIILNFNLYSGISPTSSKSHISFIGHELDGSPASFKVKVKSEQDATDLTGVLEKESKVKDGE